jgi:hypothetical protein
VFPTSPAILPKPGRSGQRRIGPFWVYPRRGPGPRFVNRLDKFRSRDLGHAPLDGWEVWEAHAKAKSRKCERWGSIIPFASLRLCVRPHVPRFVNRVKIFRSFALRFVPSVNTGRFGGLTQRREDVRSGEWSALRQRRRDLPRLRFHSAQAPPPGYNVRRTPSYDLPRRPSSPRIGPLCR